MARSGRDLGEIARLELRHPAALGVDHFGCNAVPRKHRLRRLADARVVVIDEAGGVEHRLAPGRRRGLVDRRRGAAGAAHKRAAVVARERGVAVDPRDLFQKRAGQPVVAVARPIGERRDMAAELAVAVGLAELALRP